MMPSLLPAGTVRRALLQMLLLFAAAIGLQAIPTAQARAAIVVCHADDAELDFGNALTGTGSVDYDCRNYGLTPVTFTLCIGLGTPSWPGTAAQPKLRKNSNYANFNVYTNPAATAVWTTAEPLKRTVTIPAGIGTRVQGSISFYGRIPAGQNAPAGTYDAFFYNTKIGFVSSGSNNCQTTLGLYSGQDFTLDIRAQFSNDCRIETAGDASLGPVLAAAGAATGTTTIGVRCPTGTPYNIGLKPSNGNTAGLGALSGSGSNTDKPAYQLRSGSGSGPVWGNTATSSSVGNGVSGTGNGNTQNFNVHVNVPNTNVKPDTYRDTVTITLNF